jgi:hypothetical protein
MKGERIWRNCVSITQQIFLPELRDRSMFVLMPAIPAGIAKPIAVF